MTTDRLTEHERGGGMLAKKGKKGGGEQEVEVCGFMVEYVLMGGVGG